MAQFLKQRENNDALKSFKKFRRLTEFSDFN